MKHPSNAVFLAPEVSALVLAKYRGVLYMMLYSKVALQFPSTSLEAKHIVQLLLFSSITL